MPHMKIRLGVRPAKPGENTMAAEAHLKVTHLQWGVKQSFRGYVEGAGGTITIAGGTERTPDGSFTFPVDEAVLSLNAEGQLEGRATFKGEVSFKAHGGMLNVFLAEPILEITAGEAKLTVADTLSRKYRTEVARLDLVGMSQDEAGNLTLSTALSMDGIQWLGDHYPLRAPLDQATLLVG
jgi:Htaa